MWSEPTLVPAEAVAVDDPYGAADDLADLDAGFVQARPLRTGERVRSVAEPVFSSDRSVGDVGQVVESQERSSLVRWADGTETWASRASLEPLRTGDRVVARTTTDGVPATASQSTSSPVEGTPASGGLHKLLRLVVPIIVFAPAVARLLRSSTSAGILLLLVVLTGVVTFVWILPRHRRALHRSAVDAETTGTIDGE